MAAAANVDEAHAVAAGSDVPATVSEDEGDEDGDDETDEGAAVFSNRAGTGWAASRVSRRASEDMGRPPRVGPPRLIDANARIDDERGSFDCFVDARVV